MSLEGNGEGTLALLISRATMSFFGCFRTSKYEFILPGAPKFHDAIAVPTSFVSLPLVAISYKRLAILDF